MGGGARSSRQREQQIALSQWEPQDEVAPNSLRPMTRRSRQKPISISRRGSGCGGGAAVCLQRPGFAWPAPSAPRLSPPRSAHAGPASPANSAHFAPVGSE